MLILTTAHLNINLDHLLLLLFYFTHLTLVLVTWSLLLFVCGFGKVNMCAFQDRVKAN